MSQNLFEDGFLKNLLSFMNDSVDSRSNSSECTGETFFANHYKAITSACENSFSISTEKSLVSTQCNFNNRLYTTWSTSATGSISSIRESIPTRLSTFSNACFGKYGQLDNTDKITESCLDKTNFFKKCLKTSFLPILENHPSKARLFKESYNYYNKSRSATKESPHFFKEKAMLETGKYILPFPTESYQMCKFCLKNGEPKIVYTGHLLKVNGIITCPVLRRHICDLCGATGNYSHTRKYCPLYEEPLAQIKYKKFADGMISLNFNHK